MFLHLLFFLQPDQVGVLVENIKETVAVLDLPLDLVTGHEAEEEDGLVDGAQQGEGEWQHYS